MIIFVPLLRFNSINKVFKIHVKDNFGLSLNFLESTYYFHYPKPNHGKLMMVEIFIKTDK